MTALSQGSRRKMITYLWSRVKGQGNQNPLFFLKMFYNENAFLPASVLLRAELKTSYSQQLCCNCVMFLIWMYFAVLAQFI